MSRINVPAAKPKRFTHEGAPAKNINAYFELRRTLMSCLLWEDQFYESGASIADRIASLVERVKPEHVAELAEEARRDFNLRHAPLLLLRGLIKTGAGKPGLVAGAIENTIQRPDELAELVALYWKDGRTPLAAQLKKGLARALKKFNGYSLAKYNRDAPVKLRDVLFMTHAKPKNSEQADVWARLAEGTLPSPDTWEVALSAGADKKETFERLIREGKLGYFALLRNLRNMAEAGCDTELVNKAIVARGNGADRVLPFRFVAAARAAPQFERAIDKALVATIDEQDPFYGSTVVLVDVSGSMQARLSEKSDMTRMDAAATLASMIPGDDVRVFTFSRYSVEVPPRRGMAGVEAIINSQPHGMTYLGEAVSKVNQIPHDRLIVITDEQSRTRVPDPVAKNAYMINVASYQNGVGYYGKWKHIDGFSERVLTWMREVENNIEV